MKNAIRQRLGWRSKVIVVCLAFAALSTIFGEVDYRLLKAGRRPWFTLPGEGVADGGTFLYQSLLYVVVDHHGYSDAPRPEWAHGDGWAFDIGPEIVYRFPHLLPWWRNKTEVRTVIDEERRSFDEQWHRTHPESTDSTNTIEEDMRKEAEHRGGG